MDIVLRNRNTTQNYIQQTQAKENWTPPTVNPYKRRRHATTHDPSSLDILPSTDLLDSETPRLVKTDETEDVLPTNVDNPHKYTNTQVTVENNYEEPTPLSYLQTNIINSTHQISTPPLLSQPSKEPPKRKIHTTIDAYGRRHWVTEEPVQGSHRNQSSTYPSTQKKSTLSSIRDKLSSKFSSK